MKTLLIIMATVLTLVLTACDGGRYEGLRLHAPGAEDHGTICGVHDWKTDEVVPVKAVPEDDWDRSDWTWVPREGCPR